MRSLILALAFAAPLSAVAATPNTFTSPMTNVHQAKPQEVFMTFVNYTSSDREVRVGNDVYKVNFGSIKHLYAPVGSTIRVYSQTNSKINGQVLMQVAESDRDTNVVLK
jgi:hypothetical protein